MAMIKCDACGAMLDPKGLKKQNRTEGELEIDFFRCGKCGKEYIGFISNKEMKQRVKEIKSQRLKIQLMMQKKMQKKAIRKEKAKLERMKSKAMKMEQDLKHRYEEGNFNGQKAAAGAETENPVGVQNPQDRGDDAETVQGHDFGERGGENGLEHNAGNVLLFRAPDAEYPE